MKQGVEHLCFTGRYERTALFTVWHGELRALSDPTLWSNRLLGKQEEFSDLAADQGATQCQVARKMLWRHVTYSTADVILVEASAPCWIECACWFSGGRFHADRFALLVTALAGGTRVTETATRWQVPPPSGDLLFLDEGRRVQHAAMWDVEDAEHVLVIER